jgi:hypothetical protein
MRKWNVIFEHGENSRISNVILKTLKSDQLFKVTKINTPPHLRDNDPNFDHVYKTYITFKEQDKQLDLNIVRDEIISFIPDVFPLNYFFKFIDAFSFPPFNYKLEFSIQIIETGQIMHCYTKIKEKREKSAKITQHKIITV